ncbi:uncharacterized protein LOC18434710 [Amborella trichopoda]|uniref:Uncharacterized protein n=1 Tax=Amborella trichopoda TaxID=13333 RepID=W1PFU4_AMBTC|nr:uncharacterized protein LOC18434710 [Amborella trichopoda]ERN06511.1 hypothetical protein AMTR_s00058p00078540 [Amborella trichopoda]|eukprot:XP_006844836.1 uncharacterized protein LOC18434710 [Amborella trichopoda]
MAAREEAMEEAVGIRRVMRRSVYTFLQNYSSIACVAAILALPASASILLSNTLSFSILPAILSRIRSLSLATGLPETRLASLIQLKLSQTLSSSLLSLPFSLSFLLLAKAYLFRTTFSVSKRSTSSLLSIWTRLLITHLSTSLFILTVNATLFSLLSISILSLDILDFSSLPPNCSHFLSVAAAILYSIILTNTIVVCNLATVVSGLENFSAFLAILKAYILIQGRTATALLITLCTNLSLAGVEALFQYRVVGASYYFSASSYYYFEMNALWEGPLLIYIYSIITMLDLVMWCVFYKSCKSISLSENQRIYQFQMRILDDDDGARSKLLEEGEEV